MKKFDLDAAKAGAEVCTRDGRAARIISFDGKMRFAGIYGLFPIIALIKDEDGKEYPRSYTINGNKVSERTETEWDLMMKS